MLEKRSNSRTVFGSQNGRNPPSPNSSAVGRAMHSIARQFQRLTVAQQSSDLKANSVGERREIVDDDDVRRSRCAGDAL